jgi:hypothetical protein
MPCRSVIFTGNEIELNGLMYRQMAGKGMIADDKKYGDVPEFN